MGSKKRQKARKKKSGVSPDPNGRSAKVAGGEHVRRSASDEGEASAGSGVAGRAPEATLRTGVLWVLVVALLVGLGVATHLTRVHLSAVYGQGASNALCNFGSGFNCVDVVGSEWASFLGIVPWSVLAIPAYAVMIMLALLGQSKGHLQALGLLFILGILSSLLSLWLLYVSKVYVGSFCPFCMIMYAVGFLALILPPLAAPSSALELFKRGLEAFRNPRLMALSGGNALLTFALAFGMYAGARSNLIAAARQDAVEAQRAGEASKGAAAKAGAAKAGAGKASRPSAAARRSPGGRVEIPIEGETALLGPADAPVTISVFEDFQCPFCRRMSNTLELVHQRYPKEVKIAFYHFPMNTHCNEADLARSLHPDACNAAAAAECARRQGRFWPYYHLLFKNQRHLKVSDLRRYASSVGLDADAFNQCMRDPATMERIKADTRIGKAVGVNGTPIVFINGKRPLGPPIVEVFSAIIDAELQGKSLSASEIRSVKKADEIVGKVEGPEMVRVDGPFGPFEIDAFEAHVEGGRAVSRPGLEATGSLTWFEADKACKAAGKRLCTEAEWLSACQGRIPVDENGNGVYSDDYATGTTYPYGDIYQPGYCRDSVERPKNLPAGEQPPLPDLTTGNHPKCRSSAGVYDMSGNLREWVGTVAPKAAYMGGAFYSGSSATCTSRVESVGPFYRHPATGFRCCRGGEVHERITHPGRQVGERLAPFTAPLIDGGRFDSRSLEGHVALLTFWASWCGPCRKELPAYASIYPDLEKKGFRLIAVNVDKDVEAAKAFLDKTPVNFPVVIDPDNTLLDSFDTVGMPTSFLIDKQGRIRLRRRGYSRGDEKRLYKTVLELLDE